MGMGNPLHKWTTHVPVWSASKVIRTEKDVSSDSLRRKKPNAFFEREMKAILAKREFPSCSGSYRKTSQTGASSPVLNGLCNLLTMGLYSLLMAREVDTLELDTNDTVPDGTKDKQR